MAERSEVEAVYSRYTKHPATHAWRKRVFGDTSHIFNPITMQLCMKLAFTIAHISFFIESTWLWDGFEGDNLYEPFLSVVKGSAQNSLHKHIYTCHLMVRVQIFLVRLKKKQRGNGRNPESIFHNFPGIPRKKHLLLFEIKLENQLKLERIRLAPSLISIIRSVSARWHDCYR